MFSMISFLGIIFYTISLIKLPKRR